MPKLLVVDDDIEVREFIVTFFRKRNIEVISATNGREAVLKVETETPTLVLLDIKMPDMDGIEALKVIKERFIDTKVIMVTGQNPEDENAFEQCRKFGAMDYIHKPLELAELEKKVLSELR